MSGFILVPGKRIQDKAFVKVFQRAVTALEATVDPRDKKLVIFAGSKDGVVKVCYTYYTLCMVVFVVLKYRNWSDAKFLIFNNAQRTGVKAQRNRAERDRNVPHQGASNRSETAQEGS